MTTMHDQPSLLYRLSILIQWLIVHTYYRIVQVSGVENVPDNGGIIFVAGPHCNQMIDAAVVMPSILQYTGRQVSNLVPAIWMATGFTGRLAKWSGAITLNRPVDAKEKGLGVIYLPDLIKQPLLIRGIGTRFDMETRSGDYIFLPRYNNAVAMSKIDKIISAEELVLKDAFSPVQNAAEQVFSRQSPYFIASKLDRRGLYSQVSEHLGKGGSMMIFPEGCSHDTGRLLPLYGAAVMALEARATDPKAKICIVPSGISYSAAHHFRSQAAVQFGDPITIPDELVEMYQCGDAEKAVSSLLAQIRTRLLDVTPTVASDRDHKDKKEILFTEYDYIRSLDQHWSPKNATLLQVILSLSYNLLSLLIGTTLLLPGLICFSPVILIAESYSQKRRRFLASVSPNRITGTDTIAMGRVLAALVGLTLLYIVYTVVGIRYLSLNFSSLWVLSGAAFLSVPIFCGLVRMTILGLDLVRDSWDSVRVCMAYLVPSSRKTREYEA